MVAQDEELPPLAYGQEYAIRIDSPIILNARLNETSVEGEQPGFFQTEYQALVRDHQGNQSLQVIHAHRMSAEFLENLKRKCAKADPDAVVKVIGILEGTDDIIASTRPSTDPYLDKMHPILTNNDDLQDRVRQRLKLKAEKQNAQDTVQPVGIKVSKKTPVPIPLMWQA